MKITTHTGFVSFLLALSAFNIPSAHAMLSQSTIPERLHRINSTIKEQEAQLPNMPSNLKDTLMAGAWGNGRGRGFVNRGGGWRDGGGFYNRGGFLNR